MATLKYKDENGQWQEVAVGGGEGFTIVDNLESDKTDAALSANQGRVLKEMIEELPSGGSSKELYTIIWYGNNTPSSLIEDNKKAFEAFTSGKDVSFRVVLMENNLPIFLTPDKIEYTGGTSMLIRASSAESYYGTTAGLGIIRYSMMLYNDGHINHIGIDRFDVPTTDDVEEMIAASVGDIKTAIVAINGEEV